MILIGIHVGDDIIPDLQYGIGINTQTMEWIYNEFEKKAVANKLEEEDLDLIYSSTISKESFNIFYDYLYNRNSELEISI